MNIYLLKEVDYTFYGEVFCFGEGIMKARWTGKDYVGYGKGYKLDTRL